MTVLKKVLLFSLLLSPFMLYAQGIPGISEPVTFVVSPEFPKPNQTVSLSAQSFSTDLNKATFKWTVNGKVFAQGAGLKEITIPSGKAGALTTVSVSVVTADIGTVTNSVSIRPAEVTLVWEADTYTPAFYKGKALEAYGGFFKVTAIPEFFDTKGKRIDPKTLIYTWKKNGNIQGDVSGYGKDSFVDSQSSYLRGGDDVSVTVTSPKQSFSGTQSISISPVIPSVVFYENSPLYGTVYEKNLNGAFRLSNEEITLRAELYNFSKPLAGLVTLDWNINGQKVPQFSNNNQITLRKDSALAGQSTLGVTAQHQKRPLQGAQNGITINFDAKK